MLRPVDAHKATFTAATDEPPSDCLQGAHEVLLPIVRMKVVEHEQKHRQGVASRLRLEGKHRLLEAIFLRVGRLLALVEVAP